MIYHSSVTFLLCIVAYNQHVVIAASTKRVTEKVSNRFGTDDIPEECQDKTFCTIRPTDYPEEYFNNMFKGTKTIRLPSLVIGSALANRYNDVGEQDDCDSTVTFDPIYRVRTRRDSEWMNVVQAPSSGYEQRIRLEICDQPAAPCFKMFPPTPDMRVFCTQKYSRWEMLIMNKTEAVPFVVDLPTCCSCVYSTLPLESRFGTHSEKVTPVKKLTNKKKV